MATISPNPALRSLRLLAGGGITTISSACVLLALSESPDGMRLKALCGLTGTTSANMTGLIDRLERAGLVERFFESHDRRGFAVRIMTKGLELLQRASLLPA